MENTSFIHYKLPVSGGLEPLFEAMLRSGYDRVKSLTSVSLLHFFSSFGNDWKAWGLFQFAKLGENLEISKKWKENDF